MITLNSVSDFVTSVHLEVVDKDGVVLDSVTGSNSETLWAKLHTPVVGTLYLDFITKNVLDDYGCTLASMTKTGHSALNDLRANILTTAAFTLANQIYTISFNWYNYTAFPVILQGLLSYNTSYIYSIFDLSSKPIEVPPGSTIIGTYRITYDAATPELPSTHATANVALTEQNKTYMLMKGGVSEYIRAYKLSRVFTKTSMYVGANVLDTSFTSLMVFNATYNENALTNYYNTYTGEIFYKCITSGGTEGAVVNRLTTHSLCNMHSSYGLNTTQLVINSNVPYVIDTEWQGSFSVGVSDTYIPAFPIGVHSICEEDVPIYPHKIVYCSDPGIIESTFLESGVTNYRATCISWSFHMVVPTPDYYSKYNKYHGPSMMGSLQNVPPYTAEDAAHCQIMYWDSAPQLTVYTLTRAYASGSYFNMTFYMDGVLLPVTTTKIAGEANYEKFIHKHVVNTSGLPTSGNGVLYIYAVDSATYFEVQVMVFCTNMYSYMVPYAGMFSADSSEITSGWISPSCYSKSSVDTILDAPVSSATDIAQMGMVQNTSVAEAMQEAKWQYNISVTVANKDKVAGVIRKYNTGTIVSLAFIDGGWNVAGDMSNKIPYYVAESNFVHFGHAITVNNDGDVTGPSYMQPISKCVNPGYFESMYSNVCNNSVQIDTTTRVVQYLSGNAYRYDANAHLDDIKSYIFREQGTDNYRYTVPTNMCSYIAGSPTLSWNGKTYDFESVLQEVENIGNIQIAVNSESIFTNNEYVSFPYCSGIYLPTDALETWNASIATNIPKTIFDDEIAEKYSNADQLSDVLNTTANDTMNTTVVNSGELINCDVLLPLSTMQVEGNSEYTHVFTFEVSYSPETTRYPALHIPKKFIRSGISLHSNVTSIYVTDGLHVIPWSLNADISQVPNNSNCVSLYDWELVLNRENLAQLYTVGTTIIVYAYVQAKTKDAWLPMDIDIRNIHKHTYPDNNGINTMILISSNNTHGDTTIVNSSKLPSSLYVESVGVIHSTALSKFTASSLFFSDAVNGFMAISGNETIRKHGIGMPTLATDLTIDFWMNIPVLPSADVSIVDCVFSNAYDTRYNLGAAQEGLSIVLDKDGFFRYYDRELLIPVNNSAVNVNAGDRNFLEYGDTARAYITPLTWYHVAFVLSEGYIQLFFNGKRKGVLQIAARTGLNNLLLFRKFVGYVAEFHVTKGSLWMDEFVPPQYAWGDSRLDDEGITYLHNALIPVTLPVAFDANIDIVNDIDNSKITYLHADAYNRRIDSNKLSNVLYLSTSDIKYQPADTIKISYVEMPLRTCITANVVTTGAEGVVHDGIHGVYMGLDYFYDRCGTSLSNSVLDFKPARTLSTVTPGNAYGFITDGKYSKLNYTFDRVVSITDKSCATVKIVSAASSSSSSHEEMFIKYITGKDLLSLGEYDVGGVAANGVQSYEGISSLSEPHTQSCPKDTFGINDFSNNIVIDIRAANPDMVLFAPINPSIELANGMYVYRKNNTSMQKYTFQITGYPVVSGVVNPDTIISTAHTAILQSNSYAAGSLTIRRYEAGNTSSFACISAYYKTNTIYSPEILRLYVSEPGYLTYASVNCVDVPDVSVYQTVGYTIQNGTLLNITDLSTNPTKFKYTTNKSIIPGETAVFKIDNPKVLAASNIDIITYAPSTYEYKYVPYSNTTGTHILTNTGNPTQYSVIFSNKFMDRKHSAFKFAYTKNSELVSLLNSNQLKIPYVTGYVANSYEFVDTITKSSTYSDVPSDTLLFEFPVFGSRQIAIGALVKTQKHGMAAYRDIYVGTDTDIKSYFMDNIRHFTYVVNNFQRHLWPDVRISPTTTHTGMCFTQYPYFNTYNIDELYVNTHFVCPTWTQTSYSDVIGNSAAPVVCILAAGTQEYKTGVIVNDAIQVDSRIITKNNIKHNIVYDTTELPIDDINSLGKFSIHSYTSEYGGGQITYVPIVKLINTNTSAELTFVIHGIYNKTVDISSFIDTITDTNIDIKLLAIAKKNTFTYEGFNTLLSVYSGPEYKIQLGLVIHSIAVNLLCVFKGMSVEIDFSDRTKYTRPEWCYYNNALDLMSENKAELVSDISTHKVKVYNPNAVNVTDYSIRLDVSQYNFTTFTTGIIAKTPSDIAIPTLYEVDDDGHVSNVLDDFNGKGLWVKIPIVNAASSIQLTLNDIANSYTPDNVFSFYEGFEDLDTVAMQYSKLYAGTLSVTNYDGGIGAESHTERGLFVGHTLSIDVVDHTLQLTGQESTSVITTNTALSNTALYEVRYNSADDTNLEIAFGALTNVNHGAILPYYNETVDTEFTFVKTDIHEGDNYFYVYYDSATANDASTSSIFNAYQDFSNIAVPGWETFNTGNMDITSGQMSVTNTNARLASCNALSPAYSHGILLRVSSTNTSDYGILAGTTVIDTAYSSLSCGKFSSLRYIGELLESSNGVGVAEPTATYTTYTMNVHQNNYVRVDQSTAHTNNGYYYVSENDIGKTQRQSAGMEGFFSIGGSWQVIYTTAYNASNTTAMIYKLGAMFKAPSSVIHNPILANTEEGSWTVDTHVFTKRALIKLITTSNDTDVVIQLDRKQFANDTDVRVTSTTAFDTFSNNTDAVTFTLGEDQNVVGTLTGTSEVVPYWYVSTDIVNAFIKTDLVKGVNELYVYYTSGTAPDASDGNDVFEFYDTFAGGVLDVSKWHAVNNTNNNGYTIAANQYNAISTPAHLRSHHLLTDKYSIMLRGSLGTATAQNSLCSVWNNDVDFFGDCVVASGYPDNIAYAYGAFTQYALDQFATTFSPNLAGVPCTVVMNNNYTDEDKRYTLCAYGTAGVIENSAYSASSGARHYKKHEYRNYTGHIRVGTSAHYPDSSLVTINSKCNWVAAWQRSSIKYEYIWSTEESGSWSVDGFTFTNRRKLTVTANDSDKGVVIKIKQRMFGSNHNIRVTRTIRTGLGLRYIDTHRTDTILSFVPANNNLMYSRTLLQDEYKMSDSRTALPITTPSTGRLGITASTGTHEKSVTVKWIRARKYYEKALAQLKIEDVSILVKNMKSDWYLIDTTVPTVKAPDTDAILSAVYTNMGNNHDSVFLERWKDFPKSDLVKNGHYGFGRHICYRN